MVHRRPDLNNAPDRWSFPGGHVEPGETASDALTRELREELGIDVVVAGEPDLSVDENEHPADGLVISLWVVRRWHGSPENTAPDETDELRWVDAGDLNGLRLAHWTCRDVVLKHAPQAVLAPTITTVSALQA
jgi:mutator protein MutT